MKHVGHSFFQGRRDQRENGKSLGRKVLFLTPLGQSNFNNLNSTLNIQEVIKFCNPGDETFETDFSGDKIVSGWYKW